MSEGVLEKLEEEIEEEMESKELEKTFIGKKRLGDREIITAVDFHYKHCSRKETLFGSPPGRWKVDIMMTTLPNYSHVASDSQEFVTKERAEDYFNGTIKELKKGYEPVKQVI